MQPRSHAQRTKLGDSHRTQLPKADHWPQGWQHSGAPTPDMLQDPTCSALSCGSGAAVPLRLLGGRHAAQAELCDLHLLHCCIEQLLAWSVWEPESQLESHVLIAGRSLLHCCSEYLRLEALGGQQTCILNTLAASACKSGCCAVTVRLQEATVESHIRLASL